LKLRVVTYNIHKCIGGLDRRYDPARTADALASTEPDVVLLQEVDDGAKRSKGDRQVDRLAELTGLGHRTFFPNVAVRGGGQYGNAVLSRYPIVQTSNVDLTVSWKKRRSVLHAELRVRHQEVDRIVHVFNMHLGLAEYERKIQLKRFLECDPFARLHHETPIIVGGDLNDVYGRLWRLLTPAGFRGPSRSPRTFPAWAPLRALDGIYVRGGVEVASLARAEAAVAKRASDHLPLWADLLLGPHSHNHTSHAPGEAAAPTAGEAFGAAHGSPSSGDAGSGS
jgi:endonuclease/exonuclease/phosphatase family metal-dependent hydrolase